MTNLKRACIFLYFFLLLSIAHAHCISASYDSKPLPVILSGYLVSEKDWGPPNFGDSPKTDSKFSVLLLKLDKPVTTCATDDNSSRALDCVQVFPMNCGHIAASMLYSQHVTIAGILGVASSPYEVTALTVDCKTLTKNAVVLSSQKKMDLNAYHCQSSGGGIE